MHDPLASGNSSISMIYVESTDALFLEFIASRTVSSSDPKNAEVPLCNTGDSMLRPPACRTQSSENFLCAPRVILSCAFKGDVLDG